MILAGVFIVLNYEKVAAPRNTPPYFLLAAGIGGIVFFGICSINILRLLFSRNSGLTIDTDGITDNSHSTSVGFIDWDDITKTKILNLGTSKTLLLFTDKPDKYINRAKTRRFRRVLQANHKIQGTPISIISNTLDISIYELQRMINKELNNRR